MTVLSLLNPFGWLGWGGPAKLSGGNQPSGGDPMSYAGKSVTPERALELAAYWACVKLIAQTIGTLSCRLYTQAANGSRAPAVENPLYDLLLHQPNADHSAVEFWEGVGGCLGIWGNSFALKGVVGNRLVALELLRPWHMQVLRDEFGAPVYRYNDPVHGLQTYGPDDLFVVRGFGLCDLTGFAPIQFARQTLGSAIAADEAAGSVFRNGMRTSGWFKYTGSQGASKGILNDEQQAQARAALIRPYSGSENTGKVGLLPGDFDWLKTDMNPVDAELLNNRRMNVEEICRFFGVPPILVGHSAQGQTMWGTGVDSIVLGWMTTGLRPYLKRIEAAISRDIIGRSDRQTLIVAFDTTELTRGDNRGQSEIDQSLANTGIKTRNEIRAERNLPPMAGGDTLTVQSALLPIDKLGQVAQLPSDKPVDGGADIEAAASEEAKRAVRLVAAAMKYSEDQPRDSHGRFSSGGGAPAGLTTREKLGLVGAGVATLALGAALHRAIPYRSSGLAGAYFAGSSHRAAIEALHNASVHTPITEAERAAVVKYTGVNYASINKKLRLGNKPDEDIKNIDSAISKSALAENTVVYRGLNMNRSKRIIDNAQAGDDFVDRGYPSTSISEGVARDFAKNKSGPATGHVAAGKEGYVLSINVDKGASALPLKGGFSQSMFLHEVLLPRSSAFRVLNVDHDTKTIYAQHLGVATGGRKMVTSADDLKGDADANRFVSFDGEMEVYPAPDGDTTAEDYVGYTPPPPRDGKAFDPSEDRDDRGRWTSGSGRNGAYTAKDTGKIAVAIGAGIAGLHALGWLAGKPVAFDPVDGVTTSSASHLEAAQFLARHIKKTIVPDSLVAYHRYLDAERENLRRTVGVDRVAAAKRMTSAIRYTAAKIVHDSTMSAIAHIGEHLAVRAGLAAGLSPRHGQVEDPYKKTEAIQRVASALINGVFRTSRAFKSAPNDPDVALVGGLAIPTAALCLENTLSGISSYCADELVNPSIHDAADAMRAELSEAQSTKAFDPSEARDDHGEWSGGGSGGGAADGSGGNGTPTAAQVAQHNLTRIATGAALTAVAALATVLAPEAAVVVVATPFIIGAADTMFYTAGLSSARQILHGMGVGGEQYDRVLREIGYGEAVEGKAAKTDASLVADVRKKLRSVGDEALQAALDDMDSKHPKAANKQIVATAMRDACARFKAKLA